MSKSDQIIFALWGNMSKSYQLLLDGPRGKLYEEVQVLEYLLRFAEVLEFVSLLFILESALCVNL